MKRIISVILLLTMCVACFAGCAKEEESANGNAALDTAKEYLYTMYKDMSETKVDYTVVSQVRIDDVTYPITWTTNAPAENVAISAGENNMTVVDITASTKSAVAYDLIATLKDADGNTASVTFKCTIPQAEGEATTLTDGTYVILAGNLTMTSIAQDKSYGYPYANEVTVANGTVTGHTAADVLTIKAVDGGYTIQDAYGRYFYLKGTYNSFNVDAAMPAEGHIFTILAKDGKYLIQNTLAMKTLAYSASYTSWGCYPELTDDHASLVDIIAVTAPEGGSTPDPKPETPDPKPSTPSNPSGPSNTGSYKKVTSVNDGDKIVIVNPDSNMALSMVKTGFYNIGVDVSGGFGSISNEEIFTVKKNSDGSITLTSASGKKVALADSYSSLNEEGTNDKWTLSDAGNGNFYLLNVGREIYLEWFASKNNWSAYNPGADKLTGEYVLAFYKA